MTDRGDVAWLNNIHQSVIEHILAARVVAIIGVRAGVVPVVPVAHVVHQVIKPELWNGLRAKPDVYFPSRHKGRIVVPYDIVIDNIWSVLRLIRRAAVIVIIALKDIAVRGNVGSVEMLKDVVVDVMAPLADALRRVAHNAVLEVVKAGKRGPRADLGV